MMSILAERIKLKMKELDMTQEELAGKMDITRGAITHYLSERRVPSLKMLGKLATVLKTNPAWLLGTDAPTVSHPAKKEIANRDIPDSAKHRIPVLTWEQAAVLAKSGKIKPDMIKEWVPHFYTEKSGWFALRVQGDAMTAPAGRKSFHEGDIIIVDPDQEVAHGHFVIALPPRAKEVTFKQYVVDAGTKYLKPLNLQYPITKMDAGTQIHGIIVTALS